MLGCPISSPKMTRMLGLRPEGAEGVAGGVACAGVAFGASASAPEVMVAAAASADEPNRMLRRLREQSCFSFNGASCRSRSFSRLVMLLSLLSVLHRRLGLICSASFLVL